MKTLECVGSEELIDFLSNEELLFTGKAETSITMKNCIFDFSQVNQFRKRKSIRLKGTSLKFENCIITGCLFFENCVFEYITFKYCIFRKPEFIGQAPQQLESIYFLNVSAEGIVIENSFFDCPIGISAGSITGIRFSHITCPRLYLQSMYNRETTLSIRRFLGRRIYLPSDNAFKQLHVDDVIVRQIEGNTKGWQIKVVDLT